MPPVNSGTTTQPATAGTIDESFDPVLNDDNLSFPEAASISTPTIDNTQTNTDKPGPQSFQ